MNVIDKSWSIRRAELEDAPAVLSIFQQCNSFPLETNRSKNINLIDIIDWLENASGPHPFLVVESSNQTIAWCSLECFYGLPAFDSACEISLYVTQDWQGRGVGKSLLEYLEKYQNMYGFSHLIAYIYADNIASLNFFKKHGFEQWGRLPRIAKIGSKQEDVYLFGKEFINV